MITIKVMGIFYYGVGMEVGFMVVLILARGI